MKCPFCHAEVPEKKFCIKCGKPLAAQAPSESPPPAMTPSPAPPPPVPTQPSPTGGIQDYLLHAIVITVFTCNPLGIAAIVFAAKVKSAIEANQLPEAQKYSAEAKKWCLIALISGIVWVILLVILGIIGSMDSYGYEQAPYNPYYYGG